jgi:hypothetical protein
MYRILVFINVFLLTLTVIRALLTLFEIYFSSIHKRVSPYVDRDPYIVDTIRNILIVVGSLMIIQWMGKRTWTSLWTTSCTPTVFIIPELKLTEVRKLLVHYTRFI